MIKNKQLPVGGSLADIERAIHSQRQQDYQEFKEMIEKLQKQCYEADGTIDGVTALHNLLTKLKEL